jgi:hypothetical protein
MTDQNTTKRGRRFARTPKEPGEAGPVFDASKAADPSPPPQSKIAQVTRMLEGSEGASLDELVTATGWLPHTTRAALTGLKKKGKVITKGKRDDVTCYFIASPAA